MQQQEQIQKPQETKKTEPESSAAGKKPAKQDSGGEPAKPPILPQTTTGAKAKIEEKKEEKKEAKPTPVLERKMVIPLARAYAKPAKKRSRKALQLVKQFAARHAKTSIEKVKIDEKLNRFINSRGAKKPPKKLKILLAKDKEGNVRVSPA